MVIDQIPACLSELKSFGNHTWQLLFLICCASPLIFEP